MTQVTTSQHKKGLARWCPGCGNHFFLTNLHKAVAEMGVPPHEIAVISGVGCSSRLPYYMNTYAMRTIHGRAAAIAPGAKVVNPNLTMWQISGDGDGLAIGGNHFIHAARHNVSLNVVLLNNHIYDLAKGQYSPTSSRGFVSESSPYGTVEDPSQSMKLCFGARGRFSARAVANDTPHTTEVLQATYKHKGASLCEILQNCAVFNNGTYESIYTRDGRKQHAVYVEHGRPLLFGEDNEYSLVQDGFGLEVVRLGESGVAEKGILVHDAHAQDGTLHLKLTMMDDEHGFPVVLGVIRNVEAPTYDEMVNKQIEEVVAKKHYHSFAELSETNDIWEVK